MSATSARYHIAGRTETGPFNEAVLVTSGADYYNALGGRTRESAAVHDDVALFLAEGGREVYVTRVGGTSPTPADYVAALDATGDTAPGGCVAIPEHSASRVGVRLLAHAHQYGKTAILTGGQDDTEAVMARTAQHLRGRPGSDAAGLFWPWITTWDATGRPRHQNPTGYIAAARARAHYRAGYWANPDGQASAARTVHALRFPNTPASNEALADQFLSPLVTTRNGVELHGWWSLAADSANFPYLDTRDLLNNIAAELAEAYDEVTSHTWDTLWKNMAQITAMTKGVLSRLAKGGAFNPKAGPEGTTGDPGYHFTVTTPDLQPPDRNVVIVRVAVRPRTHAILVGVRVFHVPLTTPLEVTTT